MRPVTGIAIAELANRDDGSRNDDGRSAIAVALPGKGAPHAIEQQPKSK